MADSLAKQIEDIFVAHTSLLIADPQTEDQPLGKVLGFDPNEIDRLDMPLVTMYYLLPSGSAKETGGGEEVSHRWTIYLYVALADWQAAQEQMRDVSWKIVQNFRQHRNDYSDAAIGIYERDLKRSNPPLPGEGAAWLRGSWELEVTANEF